MIKIYLQAKRINKKQLILLLLDQIIFYSYIFYKIPLDTEYYDVIILLLLYYLLFPAFRIYAKA